MSKKEWLSLAILVAVLLFAVIRYHNRHFTETKSRIMMGTIVEVSLTSNCRNVANVVEATFDLIGQYEKKFSYYDTTSTLWAINNSNGKRVAIDEEFYNILTIAEDYYHKTGGKYDVTISPLTDLWHSERITLPPADSIEAAKSLVGFDRIVYTQEYLTMPAGMRLNLGSVAKGYIVDKAVEYAKSLGIAQGHINAGGDIRLFGNSKRGQKIGIKHPRKPNSLIATIVVKDKAIVTSGDYERNFEIDGEIYHHIIDPTTGYPVKNIFSVTIIADNTTIADILSTAVFLVEPDEAINLIKSVPEAEGIIYFQDDEGITSLRTEGIKDIIIE